MWQDAPYFNFLRSPLVLRSISMYGYIQYASTNALTVPALYIHAVALDERRGQPGKKPVRDLLIGKPSFRARSGNKQ